MVSDKIDEKARVNERRDFALAQGKTLPDGVGLRVRVTRVSQTFTRF